MEAKRPKKAAVETITLATSSGGCAGGEDGTNVVLRLSPEQYGERVETVEVRGVERAAAMQTRDVGVGMQMEQAERGTQVQVAREERGIQTEVGSRTPGRNVGIQAAVTTASVASGTAGEGLDNPQEEVRGDSGLSWIQQHAVHNELRMLGRRPDPEELVGLIERVCGSSRMAAEAQARLVLWEELEVLEHYGVEGVEERVVRLQRWLLARSP